MLKQHVWNAPEGRGRRQSLIQSRPPSRVVPLTGLLDLLNLISFREVPTLYSVSQPHVKLDQPCPAQKPRRLAVKPPCVGLELPRKDRKLMFDGPTQRSHLCNRSPHRLRMMSPRIRSPGPRRGRSHGGHGVVAPEVSDDEPILEPTSGLTADDPFKSACGNYE